jgi:hypothetical protein
MGRKQQASLCTRQDHQIGQRCSRTKRDGLILTRGRNRSNRWGGGSGSKVRVLALLLAELVASLDRPRATVTFLEMARGPRLIKKRGQMASETSFEPSAGDQGMSSGPRTPVLCSNELQSLFAIVWLCGAKVARMHPDIPGCCDRTASACPPERATILDRAIASTSRARSQMQEQLLGRRVDPSSSR